MVNKPLVTIIIPVHNTERFLEECLLSIYNQNYKNFEVIIINDGSNDNSRFIIDKYSKIHKNRTLVLYNTKPSGSGEAASNCGIKIAKGKYVAIMDSDDISIPERIEKEVSFLETHPSYFLVSSSAEVINENSKKIGSFDVGKGYKKILKKIYLTNSIVNSSVLFRKSKDCESFYKIKYPFFNDYYSWFYYLNEGKKFFTLKEQLVKYRINLSSSTRKNLKRNFKISFDIKKEISKENFFEIDFFDRIIILCQKIIIELLPANIIDYLYLWKIKRQNIKLS